ncbi:gamma-glutamyl kinase [Amylibacter marinus]|uniref:Gamma-glutamyl kinase n=1 Tax=Amylibacter marinus TaxID=1475483 RepID=A0ABQ5VSL0_9RHOB|nr:gamma-glutamyl kinase [Amylibacter marinus]GLQ34415.1 gamma-glutamyl kinase [Amylibacter marinus]
MLIFLQKKLVLFATPKTGSTALHTALAGKSDILFKNAPAAKHISPQRYSKTMQPLVEDLAKGTCETLAVIREPLDWLGSWYRYRSRAALSGHQNSTADISYDQFVADYLSDKRPPHAAVGSQANFLSCTPDYLWRYDCMNSLSIFLSLRLEHRFDLQQMNVSPIKTLRLSPNNTAALRDYFKPDLDLYETAISDS